MRAHKLFFEVRMDHGLGFGCCGTENDTAKQGGPKCVLPRPLGGFGKLPGACFVTNINFIKGSKKTNANAA